MRISGALIFLYLIAHIFVIGGILKGPGAFDALMEMSREPLVKLLELALVGCLLFHGLNGIRICIVDFSSLAPYQKRLFWTAVGLGLVVFIIAAVPILSRL